MKKLLLAVITLLVIPVTGMASTREVCISGLVFVVTDCYHGIAITQAFVPGKHSTKPPQPKTCGGR